MHWLCMVDFMNSATSNGLKSSLLSLPKASGRACLVHRDPRPSARTLQHNMAYFNCKPLRMRRRLASVYAMLASYALSDTALSSLDMAAQLPTLNCLSHAY